MPTDTTSDITAPICKDCKYGIFDERFGEYKCRHYEMTIYDAFGKTECEHYVKEKGDANNENLR